MFHWQGSPGWPKLQGEPGLVLPVKKCR